MKLALGIVMGLLSGFLLYMMAAMLVVDLGSGGAGPSPLFVFIFLVGGWVVSTWLLLRGARTANAVFRRGFLLGAAEWLTMFLVVLIFSGRAVGETIANTDGSGAAAAGATLGGGFAAMIGGGVSVVMATVCLIGFAIAYFIGREMHDKTSLPTKRCPECAEMIQAEARKCRFCGAVILPAEASLSSGKAGTTRAI